MSIDERLAEVRRRVAEAAERSGRPPDAVRIVGVSKGHGPEVIASAIRAGLTDIGENRVQEAASKKPRVEGSAPPAHWHLVGHLQSNKAKAALDLFDTIHSIDSLRIAQRISSLSNRPIPVYLEVQFARTPDRFGFDPSELENIVREIAPLPNLVVTGLMTVAPLGLSKEDTRAVFRTLRARRDAVQQANSHIPPLGLSMGMTDDYPIAIEEGATVVRIGRAIFAD
ncbi:MAG TPA: YggS family pyridoxal phosphate-dependent enzyme [Chloroflexota bacterium]|nr:YggS family pyridoxal phosphate-dependent enzyme [Chloroflexota bacterium]